jgi:FtsX-like permease family
MTMLSLALRSVRHRAGGFVASFVSIFLGATILMAFASMLDTAAGGGRVSAADEETLTTIAAVVGGWGLIIVVFAVASTLTVSVRQRAAEMALLKSIGATRAQIGRLIVGEAAAIALGGALAAILPAVLVGALLLELLQSTDQISGAVDYRFGAVALVMGLGITFLAATLAAFVAARRAGRMRAREAMVAAAVEQPRMSWKRIVAAVFFLVAGVSNAAVTATVFNGEGIDAMQTGGQASIFFSIGLALLAPALVRVVTVRLAGPLERRGGLSGYLTALNLRQRGHQMASVLMPTILFTGIATGTLYMQSIENAATAVKTAEEKSVETLNFVVVGMIALFAAIMLVNMLVAATTYRRREFGQQRLAGSTPRQVLAMVSAEGLVLASTGVLFGSVASIFTVVPYSIARTQTVLPDATVAIYLAVVAAAAVLTLASSVGAARRAIRVPAIEAVAA